MLSTPYIFDTDMGTSEMLVNLSYNSLEDFYPACAVAMLLKVIKDPTLAQHHNEVVRVCTIYHLHIDGSFQYGLRVGNNC